MKNILIVVSALCMVLLLLQCGTSPTKTASGGDDFPNMIADAGTVIAENLGQEWANPAEVQSDPLSVVTADLPLPDAALLQLNKRMNLLKNAASSEGGTGFTIDPVTGNITLHSTRTETVFTMYDTVVFRIRAGDTLIIRVAGSRETDNRVVSSYSLDDGDGDGFLVNSNAGRQEANVVMQSYPQTGVTELLRMEIDAGESGSFYDTTDNVIVSASFHRIRGEDTLYAVLLSDADGDGAVVKPLSGTDSSLIGMKVSYDAFADAALLQGQTTSARMVVFADSTKNYAVRYRLENRYQRRVVTWSMTTVNGDSTFWPGDTVEVLRVTAPVNGGDSLTLDTLIATAVLGAVPNDSLDDALLSLHAHAVFNGSRNRETVFDFNAGTPVVTGHLPIDGTVYCMISGNSGRSIEAEASVGTDEFTATVTASDGTVYRARWNRDGSLIEYSVER